jgi:hypothetical protein
MDTELRPGEEQLRDQVTSYLKGLLSSSTGLYGVNSIVLQVFILFNALFRQSGRRRKQAF